MAVIPVLTFDEEFMKLSSPLFTKADFVNTDESVSQIIENLLDTLNNSADGVGLAAPQIGISKRIIAVKPDKNPAMVLINPCIIRKKGTIDSQESCLSVPKKCTKMVRYSDVVVSALNKNRNSIQLKGKDFLAIILQHEIDHLNGILFFQRAKKSYKDLDDY